MLGEKPILLLRPEDVRPTSKKMRVRGVFNPGAVRQKNGKILLFARVAETPVHGKKYFLAPQMVGKTSFKMRVERILRAHGNLSWEAFVTKKGLWRLPTISHLRKVLLSEDGTKVEFLSKKPDFFGIKGDGDFGVEDPAITFFEKEKFYAMTYVSISQASGISTSLATAKNLSNWKRKGIIFRQQNKDVVLFPEKINGYFVALHRPEGTMIFDKPNIWTSYSKDLVFWGRDKPILMPREKGWDCLRIGAGTVPIKTSEGFLGIYHGVSMHKRKDSESKVYKAGAILFDSKDPGKILAQTPSSKPLFEPKEEFERKGFRGGTVFPTGAVLAKNKKDLLIFSGAADENITVRKFSLKKIFNSMEFKC